MKILSVIGTSNLIAAAYCSGFGYVQHLGQTLLLGSSFAVPGANATYEYVVWISMPLLLFYEVGWALLSVLLQIIGGGTSGLTVAKRLTETRGVSVAVVEGGSFYEIDNGNYSQVPAYDVYYSSPSPTTIQPLVDWGIVTAAQTVRIPVLA